MDRSHALRGKCLKGCSAFQLAYGTQSVRGCIPTRSVGTIREAERMSVAYATNQALVLQQSVLGAGCWKPRPVENRVCSQD